MKPTKEEEKEWDSEKVYELIRIEERLKKRIEINEEKIENLWLKGIVQGDRQAEIKKLKRVNEELQKILGEGK